MTISRQLKWRIVCGLVLLALAWLVFAAYDMPGLLLNWDNVQFCG